LGEIFGRARRGRRQEVRYELSIDREEASRGVKKILIRKGKKLEVKIPAGVTTGSVVKLSNALQTSDGLPGDILIRVTVK
jgi:DnaJ-class molecular chaperone